MRISVIIPAFRAEGSIGAAVGSVLAQGREDVEVIVVDDASPDGTAEAARAAGASVLPGRVRVEVLPTGGGASRARTAGARLARGQILVFLDADDVQLPGFLDTVAATVTGEVEAVVVGRRVRTEGGTRTEASRRLGRMSGEEAARAVMREQITPFPWDKAFRRSLLRLDGPGTAEDLFPADVHRFEDLAGVLVLLSRARQVQVLDLPLIEYRVHAGSLTWGRVPTRRERDLALAHVRHGLDAELLAASRRDLATLHVLMTVLIAQSAALAGEGEESSAMLHACRADLRWRHLLATLAASPVTAAAAVLLRLSPRVFASIAQWRTRTRYR
ncbi:glycosyltransferase family 2 protein [Brachybacterium hainanense]|uniref:Glycosyltransferase family 2 protein n=1 Tax=Brachybacterium hainanense TaxID=1541174 RepID=A0ABV6RF66_9MICO